MIRIVLTGGPCAGKSTILSRLTQELEERGYKVVTVPEAATELILNGICPSSAISMEEFQNFIIDMQLMKEDLFSDVQSYYDPDKVVVFCDRGVLDGCAYVDMHPTFEDMLNKRGLTIANIHSRYDAVLHLVTAADGAEEFYQWNDPSVEGVGNNAARSESPKIAREKDRKTLESWMGHPRLRVFDNSTDFNGKIQRVLKEVFSMLGEPIPSEIERKFLIKKPTKFDLDRLGYVSATQIIQTYLTGDGVERRVRQRGNREDGYSFFYTEKVNIGHGERSENERKISAKEYIEFLAEADTALHQIIKTRYCFVYDRKYFELDIYPFSDEYAILEVELNDINEHVNLPPLEIIAEVTDDASYKNHNLARTMQLVAHG